MAHRFRGKIVVVTGASSGIGRAAAHEFARQGATLVLAARSHDSLEAAAAECRALGAEAVAIPTDVADEHAVRDLVATTTTRFGRIDVFVGNAALFVYGLFEQTPTEAFKRVVDTNLYGHLHAITALLPHWKQRGEGTYVLVGSIQSLLSAPYQSAYVTSKHAALGLVDVLGDEFAGTGIRFAALLPSTIDTPIYQNGANYTGTTSHPLPPTVSVERAGRAVVRTALHPKRYRFVGRIQASLVPLQYVFPGLFHKITKPMVQTFALRGRGAPTDGNLWTPADAGNATNGGWVAKRRRVTRPLAWAGVAAVVGAVLLGRARR
ncbi:SDR family oxidoreductase [Curtobacterium sp. GD1]|uniref:SDR family NAD(P)-dependent oxidoreductase n=1 Tax=Curtobacterium sp. GD1 TaxID=2810612 RepID=UPI001E3851DF|nr:SDR family NAD(P)-dependent oxidoreductase [Curtobacterium sp. GD1]MCC8907215.1 SDR family NAD(P)-dependent oxidoreductase [Curtobacterium sp. GD1]